MIKYNDICIISSIMCRHSSATRNMDRLKNTRNDAVNPYAPIAILHLGHPAPRANLIKHQVPEVFSGSGSLRGFALFGTLWA